MLCALVSNVGAVQTSKFPPIVVGEMEFSSFFREKYYQKFLEQEHKNTGKIPSDRETQEWLKWFHAQMVLIAEAKRAGYFEREDLDGDVVKMEKHMLVHHGMEAIIGEFNIAPRFQMALESSTFELSGTFYRLPYSKETKTQLESILCRGDRDDLAADLSEFTVLKSGEKFVGSLYWPFSPLPEVILLDKDLTVRGDWAIHEDEILGLYLYRIEYASHIDPAIRAFYMAEQSIRDELLIRNIETRALYFDLTQRHAIRVDEEILSRLVLFLNPEIDLIFSAQTDRLFQEDLFSFRTSSGELVIESAQGLINQMSGKFIRFRPRDISDVRKGIVQYVLDHVAFQKSSEMEIDQKPDFVRNREAFYLMQILDRYIKENTTPPTEISEALVYDRYVADSFRLSKPEEMEVSLFRVFDYRDAVLVYKELHESRLATDVNNERYQETIILHRSLENASRFSALFVEKVLNSATGQVLGPVYCDGHLYLVKNRRSIASSPPEFESVRAEILGQLMLESQKKATIELARSVIERSGENFRLGEFNSDSQLP